MFLRTAPAVLLDGLSCLTVLLQAPSQNKGEGFKSEASNGFLRSTTRQEIGKNETGNEISYD